MFGDNGSIVESSIQPHAKLHKHHTAWSFHHVREAMIASKFIIFHHIPGMINPAGILSKHWGCYQQVRKLLHPLLFLQGDTVSLLDLYE
jgi:hypothetical protein